MKPKVFIGSSSEGLDVAHAIQENLDSVAEVTVWDQDIFSPSRYSLESLLSTVQEMDYAIFVFAPDDKAQIRGGEFSVPRDNVVFEMGMFVSGLGRDRVVVVMQENVEDFHMLSDLLGFTPITYNRGREGRRLNAALGTACTKIKRFITSGNLRPACGYLVRYVEREEPSFLGIDCNARISLDRAYKILLYMFGNETFDEFRAFDLAFERWEELLRPDHFQTFNISNEIFETMDRMFEQGRCKRFRRILVVSYEQLRKRSACQVLKRIEEQEQQWCAKHSNVQVETRILPYPPRTNPQTRSRISHLHDFAFFSGDRERLAIIESTLTSPFDHVETPECHVTTQEKTINDLESGFEEFWGSSQTIACVLDRVAGVLEGDDAGRPAFKAFEHFFQAYPKISGDCALIIEAGYFDLRTPDDEDRFQHLDDAFYLLESVQTSCQNMQRSIFLDAFINDFGGPSVCRIRPCNVGVDIEDEAQRKQIISDLVDRMERRSSHSFEARDFELFRMRKTRNAVTEVIKRALAGGGGKVWERDYEDTTVDIFIDAPSEQICLGHREADSSRVIPRCTALMAQHYYDLYMLAVKRKTRLNELWIFDFNRYTERESVRMGAEASFVLFSWPENLKIRIVNCIYSPNGKTGSIQVITGP